MSKDALRAEAALRRAAAHRADAADGCGAGARLAELWPTGLTPRPGAVVAGHHPFRSEIDPQPLMAGLEAAGCVLALPATPPRGSAEPLAFRLFRPGEPLVRSAFGVLEPAADAPSAVPDLVLVPLLAFDRTGARLGYGAGHYDRTLPGLCGRPGVLAVGLAYAAQEVERLPAEPHDHPLDAILTERAYIPALRV